MYYGVEAKPSGKVPDTHSIGSIGDHDDRVFPITKVAMKLLWIRIARRSRCVHHRKPGA
jgi:hypothetical protein